MRFLIACSLLLLLGLASASGQRVAVFEPPPFEADAYANQAPELAPGRDGAFFYLQELYRERDRRWSGTWLVQLRPEDSKVFGQPAEKLTLASQTPVDAPHEQRPANLRLYRLGNSLAVTGRLPDPHFSGPRAVVQFFDLNGKATGPFQTLSCYFNEKADGWWDTVIVSGHGERLIWWGENRHEPPASRRSFVSVYSDAGRLQWQREVKWPNAGGASVLRSLAADRLNNLYLLLDPAQGAARWRLLCYRPDAQTFAETDIDWGGPFAWQTALTLDARERPVVGAALGHAVELGLDNRAHATRRENWTAWGAQSFALTPDGLRPLWNLRQPLEDTLRERYCMGADLELRGFEIEGDELFWRWEEEYADGGETRTRDLLTLAFELEPAPRLLWSAALFKLQSGAADEGLLSCAAARSATNLYALYSLERDPYGTFRLWQIDRKTGKAKARLVQTPVPTGYRASVRGGCFTESRTFVLPLFGGRPDAGYRLLNLSALP